MTDLPAGPFSVILADPPWRFKVYSAESGLARATAPGWVAWGNETQKFSEAAE